MKKLLMICVFASSAAYGMSENAAPSSTSSKQNKDILAVVAQDAKRLADLSERRLKELSLAIQEAKLIKAAGEHVLDYDYCKSIVHCDNCGDSTFGLTYHDNENVFKICNRCGKKQTRMQMRNYKIGPQ